MRKRGIFGRWPILGGAIVALAAAGVNAGPYHNLRYLDNPETMLVEHEGDPWNALKQIDLGAEGVSLSLGGQARLRWEHWENLGFNAANDDDFGLLRLRLHGDLSLGEYLRVFVEGKSAESTSRDLPGGRRTLDVDSVALQNAFVDVKIPAGDQHSLTLRVGRQELQYGKERLVSPLDWSNTRRTWEGFRGIVKGEGWQVDGFFTRFVPVDKYDFNDGDSDDDFYGVYGVVPSLISGMGLDVYWLVRDKGASERHTAGLRAGGTCGESGVDYDVEGAYQTGDEGELDVEAFFVAAQLGYQPEALPLKPRFYLGYDYATGDDNPDDGSAETFDQLFPLGHAYLGFIDAIGRRNIQDFSQGVTLWPVPKKLMLKADHHIFSRAESEDAVYHAGGGVLREGDAESSSDIGNELDLTVKYVVDVHTVLLGGYSHFFAGDFIEESGADQDIDFVHAGIQYTF